VRAPEEIANYALSLVKRATDDLAEYVGSLPDDPDEARDLLFEAGKAVPEERRSRRDPLTRDTWEVHAAHQVILAVDHVLRPPEAAGEEKTASADAWDALRAGDLDHARASTARMFELAAELGEDDWNYGNLIHWGHIILGACHLKENNVAGAEAELRAAGRTPGSPQLDSFGPDLRLAWTLLKQDSDEAVLDYFHQISRFWSPHRGSP
jgi:hypothetical protein